MSIRSHRLRLGMTQEELARQAGLSVRAVREIEHGRVIRPRRASFAKLRIVLQLTDDDGAQPADFSDLAVNVLGPLAVSAGSAPVELVSGSQQTLLGILALHTGAAVSVEELASVFWIDRPPAAWRNLIHVYVNRLRSTLEPGRAKRAPSQVIASIGGGYRLDIPSEALDLSRFDLLTDAARHADSAERAAGLYAEALNCWRGPVLAGADDTLCQHPAALGANRRRIAATLEFATIAAALGRDAETETFLRRIVADEPMHEALHAALITVLARSGDQASALRLFADIRARLADELGVDPGPELKAAHLAVLDGGATARTTSAPAVVRVASDAFAAAASPHQLPSSGRDFVGRVPEITQLDRWQDKSPGDTVIAITAGAGVGKTSLAVMWARSVSDQYPDGQLYINLNGQGDEQPPLPTLDALAYLLRSIGMPNERVPTSLDEAITAYRTMTAERRMLVMLDNAYSSEHVRPLLPGGADNLVLVTSRDRLSGLVAKDGARRLELDVLEPDEAVTLIGLLTEEDTVRADPEAAASLAQLCAYLPLALRIAVAGMADRRQVRLSQLVDDLSGDEWPDALEIMDDPQARVRVAFDNSYNQVPPPAQRMFRLLGLMPGADVSLAAAQALAGETRETTRELLRLLSSAHLLEHTDSGRFTFHDLLRRYAIDVARQSPDRSDLDAARERLNRYYLDMTYAAAAALNPEALYLPYETQSAPTFCGKEDALDWLDAERVNLIAAVRRAAADGCPDLAWQLCDMLRGYFFVRRFMSDWQAIAESGLSAARAQGNRLGEFGAMVSLARARWAMGLRAQAAEAGEDAVAMAKEVGWHSGLAMSLTNLGAIYGDWGKLSQASERLTEAFEVYRDHDTPGFVPGTLLGNLGTACHELGQFDQAIDYHRRSLEVFEPLHADVGTSFAYSNIGSCHLGKGDFVAAAEMLEKALDQHERVGNNPGIALGAVDLGRAYLGLGRLDDAVAAANRAIDAATLIDARNCVVGALSLLATIENSPERHQDALRHTYGTTYARTEALAAYARTLNDLGQPAEALKQADLALEGARACEYHMLEAGAASARAQSLLLLGRRNEAKAQADEAVALHRACNSVRYLDRATAVIEAVTASQDA